MSSKNEKSAVMPQANESVRSVIEQKLAEALAGWKAELSEKDFRKGIKKAGKAFGKQLPKKHKTKTAKHASKRGKKKEAA